MLDARQARMARAALGWSVNYVAERTGLHRNTIARCEEGVDSKSSTLRALEALYRSAGIVFRPDGLVEPPPSPPEGR
jgi:transcriptional regulator with XRE-family HTH domain